MYNKIHKHLTFLFTGIASLILIVMSVICLHMSEQALEKNSFLSFSGKMNTLVSNFEQQTNISQEWLAKVSENGTYQIAVYDNGVPLSYTSITLSGDTLALMAEIMEQQDDMIHDITYENPYSSPHREFSYTSKGGADYYACLVRIRRSAGDLTAVILYSTEALSRQLMTTRIRFLCINLIGILLLSVFSGYYTKRLLLPIQKSQEQQAAFISAASHELQTPLAVIISCLSAIQCSQNTEHSSTEHSATEHFPTEHASTDISPAKITPLENTTTENSLSEKQNHFLHTIETESRRMSRLVTDLLTLARSDHHTWSFHMKEVDLDTILLNAFEAFQPIAAAHEITLRIDLPEGPLPACTCDPDRISQVLGILLSNAVSYGSAGGCVKLSLRFQNGIYDFQVSDNGAGIPDSEKEHIFDRFYRIDSSRSGKEHFGLGLCIAKEIIAAHRGSIQINDTPGGGATFTVRLHGSVSPAPPLFSPNTRL